MTEQIAFTLNGAPVRTGFSAMTSLIEVLREDLGMLGTKLGCGEGRCGSCTVLLDGRPVVACLLPIALVEGRDVRTVEGLAGSEEPLSALQDALLAHGAVQCGACTPGVLMALTAWLEQHDEPTDRSVREALAGNICRCTGYHKIVEAALAVANEGAR